MKAPAKKKRGRPKGSKDSYPRGKSLDVMVYSRVSQHTADMIDMVAEGSGRTRSQVIGDQLALVYQCNCADCKALRR